MGKLNRLGGTDFTDTDMVKVATHTGDPRNGDFQVYKEGAIRVSQHPEFDGTDGLPASADRPVRGWPCGHCRSGDSSVVPESRGHEPATWSCRRRSRSRTTSPPVRGKVPGRLQPAPPVGHWQLLYLAPPAPRMA